MKKITITVKNTKIGPNQPVSIHAMIKLPLRNRNRVLKEAKLLGREGAELIRIAVESDKDVKTLKFIRDKVTTPIEADIHFNYHLALLALEEGVDCLRLNPLNITKPNQVREVIKKAKEKKVPLRIGINSGGFRKRIYGNALVSKMIGMVSEYLKIFGDMKFDDIILSFKTQDTNTTILVNRQAYKKFPFPLHVGLTATGPKEEGIIKSSLALGVLLNEHIANAIRISLNTASFEEVRVAKLILQGMGLRFFYPQILSCPTCSRCKVNLKSKVEKLKKIIYSNNSSYNRGISIALMGCPVNGPGEAIMADFGIACGKRFGFLFKRGKMIGKIKEEEYIKVLVDLFKKFKK